MLNDDEVVAIYISSTEHGSPSENLIKSKDEYYMYIYIYIYVSALKNNSICCRHVENCRSVFIAKTEYDAIEIRQHDFIVIFTTGASSYGAPKSKDLLQFSCNLTQTGTTGEKGGNVCVDIGYKRRSRIKTSY